MNFLIVNYYNITDNLKAYEFLKFSRWGFGDFKLPLGISGFSVLAFWSTTFQQNFLLHMSRLLCPVRHIGRRIIQNGRHVSLCRCFLPVESFFVDDFLSNVHGIGVIRPRFPGFPRFRFRRLFFSAFINVTAHKSIK